MLRKQQLYIETTRRVRELQRHTAEVLRRVARGETLGVTKRGRLAAVLSTRSKVIGAAALLASGRVQRARRPSSELREPVAANMTCADVLDEIRTER